jgi:hypothetical protein
MMEPRNRRKEMKKLLIGAFIVLSLVTWIYPQTNADQGLRRYIFSPQFLRRYQREIQSKFTPLQWRLEDEVRKLTDLIENRASEEGSILKQLDVVLDLEKDIKGQQLLLAVRIRNALNQEQVKKLRDLRARALNDQRLPRRNADRDPTSIP